MIDAAWQHAAEAYPHESLGVVWPAEGYERLINVAPEPGSTGLTFGHRYRYALATPGTVFVHSHPDGPQCPSARDLSAQAQCGHPFVIVPLNANGPLGPAFGWGHGAEMPYEGRPFRHGLWDCYSLLCDWYRRERGLRVPITPRDWQWWESMPELDLYRAGYRALGFETIELRDAVREGDIIFYMIRSKVPQHAALVLDADRILHHPSGMLEYDPGRRSCIDSRARWQRFASMAVRCVK